MFEHGFTAVTNRNALRRRIGGGIIVIEDQESVSAWADQTFGPASSNARVAAVLSRLMTRMGRNLGEEERARWRSIARGSEVSRPTAATATTSATR
jgi:hypothetical protein